MTAKRSPGEKIDPAPLTLINAPPSPFGRKVAVALLEKGLDYEVKYDLPWEAGSCTPEYSPLQQLPILITEAGEAVYDSDYILDWLEARHPQPPLLPEDAEASLEARKRQMLGQRLMEVAQALILELHRPEPSPAWVDRQTRKVLGALNALDSLYSTPNPQGRLEVDLGDIAVATTLLLFEFAIATKLSPDIEALHWRDRYADLTRAVALLEVRPSFAATRPSSMAIDLQAKMS